MKLGIAKKARSTFAAQKKDKRRKGIADLRPFVELAWLDEESGG
jgi:hypothetical protein